MNKGTKNDLLFTMKTGQLNRTYNPGGLCTRLSEWLIERDILIMHCGTVTFNWDVCVLEHVRCAFVCICVDVCAEP